MITSEESSRDTIDEEFEKLILNEKNGEISAQIEGLDVFRLTEEALLESPETLGYDVRSESTNEAAEASDYLSASPKQTATRRQRAVAATPEPVSWVFTGWKNYPKESKLKFLSAEMWLQHATNAWVQHLQPMANEHVNCPITLR